MTADARRRAEEALATMNGVLLAWGPQPPMSKSAALCHAISVGTVALEALLASEPAPPAGAEVREAAERLRASLVAVPSWEALLPKNCGACEGESDCAGEHFRDVPETQPHAAIARIREDLNECRAERDAAIEACRDEAWKARRAEERAASLSHELLTAIQARDCYRASAELRVGMRREFEELLDVGDTTAPETFEAGLVRLRALLAAERRAEEAWAKAVHEMEARASDAVAHGSIAALCAGTGLPLSKHMTTVEAVSCVVDALASERAARVAAEKERDEASQIATKEAVIASSALSRATAAESRAARLEEKVRRIESACGLPDPAEACRVILAIAAEREERGKEKGEV